MLFKKLNELTIEAVSHNPEIKKKVFVRKGEMGNITQIALIAFQPGQIADSHEHLDMFEIFIVQKGRGRITVDEKVIDLEAGDCVVVSPGEVHEVENNSGEVMEVLVVGEELEGLGELELGPLPSLAGSDS